MSELASFHQFLSKKFEEFGSNVSPEEILDLWRAIHPLELDMRRDVKSIQQAIDEMTAGDKGVSIDEFDASFREKHSIT